MDYSTIIPCSTTSRRRLTLDEDAQQLSVKEPHSSSRDAPGDSKADDVKEVASLPSQSRDQLQDANAATATEAQAGGGHQSQTKQLKVGREHPSNHEWISDTAQKILLGDEPGTRDENGRSCTKPASPGDKQAAESIAAQYEDTSQAVTGSMLNSDHGPIDPEVLASLPPEIQREVKLASMMRMGTLKAPQQQQQQPRPQLVSKPQVAMGKLKKMKKGANIANYFSSK